MSRTVTVRELSRRLGYCEETIRRGCRSGKIPHERVGKNGAFRFDLAKVQAAMSDENITVSRPQLVNVLCAILQTAPDQIEAQRVITGLRNCTIDVADVMSDLGIAIEDV